jgi:hypothetical protein
MTRTEFLALLDRLAAGWAAGDGPLQRPRHHPDDVRPAEPVQCRQVLRDDPTRTDERDPEPPRARRRAHDRPAAPKIAESS